MKPDVFLIKKWGAERVFRNQTLATEIVSLLSEFLKQESNEDEIKIINNTQHNQLNLIDEIGDD